jgi:hypothetical protein
MGAADLRVRAVRNNWLGKADLLVTVPRESEQQGFVKA